VTQALDPHELQEQLAAVLPDAKYPQRRFVALQGSCEATSVQTKGVGEVRVVSVDSELELRRALPGLHDPEVPFTAFLLGWSAREIPVDLAGRFVAHGRVHRPAREDRLRTLFGGRRTMIDRELAGSRLAAYLVDHYATGDFPTAAGKVTLDVAWAAWLERACGLKADSSLGLDTLVAWAATNARGEQLREELSADSAAGVQPELERFLHRRVGEAGPIVLRCWLQGRGRLLMQFAALFEVAALDAPGAPTGAIRSVALSKLELPEGDLEAIIEPLGKGAEAAFRELARRTDAHTVHGVLQGAQAMLASTEHVHLLESPRLPVAWTMRLHRFGELLRAGANAPSAGTFDAAVEAFRALEGHQSYLVDVSQRPLERAQMAIRLLGWLVARPDAAKAPGPQSYADAQVLGRWYAQEGGYVDWARRRARGGGEGPFADGIEAVVHRADAAREELDVRFAHSYAEWLRANTPRKPLLPIHEAAATFVGPYLEGPDHRRMLVLLMDGMAWAQAVELLEDLGTGAAPWEPIAWNNLAFDPGNVLFTPVLAAAPSLTKVSRSAFFAGKVPKAGEKVDALIDADLWADNKSVRRLYSGTDVPKLRVKNDGFNIDGTPTKATLTLIADESQPVVALVINAIDDHLKTSTQEDEKWTVDRITALRELLDASAQAGRAVLLAADHGNVSGQRMQFATTGAGERGSRWRTWFVGDSIKEYEVAIESAHAWAPKGEKVQGVVLLADDAHSYGTQRHYGAHGGATLAEVVAPTFVIGTPALHPAAAGVTDAALERRSAHPPAWWHLDVAPAPTIAATPAAKKRPKKAEQLEAIGQLTMPAVAPAPKPEVPVEGGGVELHVSSTTRTLVDKLVANPLFKARAEDPARRELVVAALEILIERGNSVSQASFAAHVGQPKYRVGGVVSKLGEVLNTDGYEMVVVDRTADLVILNLAQLRQGFGL
jgi:hypothetical protein